jgi:uncharacterized protein (TIGR03437 family)
MGILSRSARLAGLAAILLILCAPAWAVTSAALPAFAPEGVTSSASFQPGIVPSSWFTITGANLSPVTDSWENAIVDGNLPTSLDGVTVSVSGQLAYLAYISSTQINAVAPAVGAGTVSVTVITPSGASPAVTVVAQAVQPAFFPWGNYAVATHQDYSLAVKSGTFSGVATGAAAPGELIILWGTGFGPTTPAVPGGIEVPFDTTYYTADPVTVTVGNVPATVYGTALAPGYAGLYQVAIQIPESLAGGDYPVVASISGAQSPASTLITVAVPQLQSLSFSPNTVASGESAMASLMLSGAAPPGGAVVSLSSNSGLASVPATVTVPAGTAAVNFAVSAGTVNANQNVTITASYGGKSVRASLSLTPTVNPQCANISGNWEGSESGSATFTVVATIETDMFTDPISGSGPVTIMQTGCSIQYDPIGESDLIGTNLTPSQLAQVARTGTVSGNHVTVSGILALIDTIQAEQAGLTIASVTSNVVNASGDLAGNMMTLNETGLFAASGTYSISGENGSFTLTISTSSVATFVEEFGTPAGAARAALRLRNVFRSPRRVEMRVTPGVALLGATLEKVVHFSGR